MSEQKQGRHETFCNYVVQHQSFRHCHTEIWTDIWKIMYESCKMNYCITYDLIIYLFDVLKRSPSIQYLTTSSLVIGVVSTMFRKVKVSRIFKQTILANFFSCQKKQSPHNEISLILSMLFQIVLIYPGKYPFPTLSKFHKKSIVHL